MGHTGSRRHQIAALIAQGILEQKSTEIGNGPTLLFGAAEQSFMNVITERDRNPSRLTLKHAKAFILH